MTRITKQHKLVIGAAMDRMEMHIKPQAHMPLDTFLSLFFTAKQQEQMEVVSSFVDMEKVESSISSHTSEVPTPEGIPFPEGTAGTLQIKLGINTKYEGFHPKKWRFQPNASPDAITEFDRCLQEITLQGRIMAMWSRIQKFYTEEAKSHEEMRYLFPGTVSILRKARLDDIAGEVEDVNRRPTVSIDKDMIPIFRYMNQWFAAQLMMDTFQGSHYPLCGSIRDADTVTLRLAGSLYDNDMEYLLKS